MRLGSVINQYISRMIENLRIELWFCVSSVICKGRIGGSHLEVIDTVRDTSERSCLLDIAESLSVDYFLIYNSGESKALQVIKSSLLSNLSECFDCNDIHRLFNRFPYSHPTFVGEIPVIDFFSVFIAVWFVFDRGVKSHCTNIKCRGIS